MQIQTSPISLPSHQLRCGRCRCRDPERWYSPLPKLCAAIALKQAQTLMRWRWGQGRPAKRVARGKDGSVAGSRFRQRPHASPERWQEWGSKKMRELLRRFYGWVISFSREEERNFKGNVGTHIKYGNTMLSLNVLATQIKFNGSWSTLTCPARLLALLLHRNDPPSGLTHMPK